MDSKKNISQEVQYVLEQMHQKIDSLKEKVDKLCETTNCLEELRKKTNTKESDKS